MNRVDFNRRDNVEAGLLEAEAEAAGAGEKVYPNRSAHWLSIFVPSWIVDRKSTYFGVGIILRERHGIIPMDVSIAETGQ